MDRYLLIIGRILLALIFLISGFGKIAHWAGNESMMAAKGIPLAAVALAIAVVFEIVGGLSLFTGYFARWGALALFLYLIPVSLTIHNFWAVPEAERQNQMIHFLKNVSIMGGLLVTASRSQSERTF
ncbi:MAG: DoxX family protein [Acidobacteriota bacterium]|nr:DoxX family protein [Acidobacteriota bacterium]